MERSPTKPSAPTSPPSKDELEPLETSRRSQSPVPTTTKDNSDTTSHSPEGDAPPLPNEGAPPLPDEPPPLPAGAPPSQPVDDGWDPVWDGRTQAFYFYNRFTNQTQWENPRVPQSTKPGHPGVEDHDRSEGVVDVTGGYNPAIHGDYDPNADYAQPQVAPADGLSGAPGEPGTDPSSVYAATGAFNRFTGKWQAADFTPERFTDEQKSKRQMNAFFDVDAAANSHNGRSLRAERASKKLSKTELKAFKEKRREKKEEKRRAWLRD